MTKRELLARIERLEARVVALEAHQWSYVPQPGPQPLLVPTVIWGDATTRPPPDLGITFTEAGP